MKIRTTIMLVVALGFVATGCRDKAAEKKIAELESRLAQLEGNKTTTTPTSSVPLPATAATPAAEEKPTGPLPVIEFGTTEHDFGTVAEGQKVSYTYTVKNTGAAPLLIQNAQPSCGCTVPDWTKTPIAVGGTGFVKAEFDTHGKAGIQNKTITVTSNSWPRTTVIKFKAMVTPKSDGANGPLK
ncbi:MAG TPA: DUF1573 domain-containing protein [Cyclobacteriaceae bacterium]|nr:DUF1573 domain-containing protein [Cyclobacteriaceae bacterium]